MIKLLKNVSLLLVIIFIHIIQLNAVIIDKHEPSLIYSHKNWHFLDYYDDDTRICYLFSRKIDSFSNDKRARDSYIVVTFYHKIVQVSINVGYELKNGSAATVSLDGTVYVFRKQENSQYLFLEKDYYDYKFLQDLKKAKSIYIFSESKDYKYAVDVFSFRGFEEVYGKLIKNCKNIALY